VFNFKSKHHLVKFARQGFFLGQKEISRTCIVMVLAPCLTPPEEKLDRAARSTPYVIDTAMLIKALVLCCKNSLFHQFWNFTNLDQCTPLFAELTQQLLLQCCTPATVYWTIVSEYLQRGKRRVGK